MDPEPTVSNAVDEDGGLWEFLGRFATLTISYLIYLLIMFILLDFWEKLKEPTKAFIRSKIEKYVDSDTISAYLAMSKKRECPDEVQEFVSGVIEKAVEQYQVEIRDKKVD